MTEYSSNFQDDQDTALVTRYEEMIRKKDAYFFDVEELENIADFYLEKGNFRKAKKAAEYGLNMFPNSTALLLKKANALTIGGKAKEALQILNFLEKAEPVNTDILLLKAVVCRNLQDHEGTKDCLLKAINYSSENREELFLDLAFEQEMVDDYTGAIESLKESLKYNPQHEASLFEIGYCYDMADELEEGATFFQNFLDEDPYNFIAWFNLASCFEKLGLFEKAIEAADFCIVIKDEFTMAHVLKGNCYVSLDNDVKAIDAYNDAIVHEVSNPGLFCSIGECYERTDRYEDAIMNYERALAIDENHSDSLMGIGAVKELEDKMDEAINFYAQALKIDQDNYEYWHIFSEALTKAGRIKEALEAFSFMISQFDEDEETWLNYADLLSEHVSLKKAINMLKEGLGQFVDSSELMYKLVALLLQNGETQEAEYFLTKALQFDYDGHKSLLSQFPEATKINNIARLIELYKEH